MNDILDIEKMRYTVRSYSDKKLEQEKLESLGKRLPIEDTVFYNKYDKE